MVGRPSPGFAESGLLFSISESGESLRGRITVVHLTLDQVVEVRVLARQPHRFRCRPHRLARPRTPPSQGGNAGSNPAGATIRRAGKAFWRELSPLVCPERSRGAPFGSEPEAQPFG